MGNATYKLQSKVPGILEAVMRADTQTNLANLLGVSQQSVSEWVKQKYVPLNRALQIEELYGIDTDRLIKPDHLLGG